MNKCTLFFLAFFFSVSVVGQDSEQHQRFLKTPWQLNNSEFVWQGEKELTKQKNADALKLKLDSTISEGVWKNEFDYNEQGKLVELRYSEWKEGSWDLLGKEEHTFENDGEFVLETIINYNLDFNQWKQLDKVVRTYNLNGILVQQNFYSWKSGRWFEEDKIEYKLNEAGKVYQEQTFKKEANKWVNVFFYEFEFDSLGKVVQQLRSIWETDQWVFSQKYEYEFDEYENVIKYVLYVFENEKWTNRTMSESNIEDNVEFTTITYYWENEEWMKGRKYESMKDGQGNFIKEINSIWNGAEWITNSMTEFEHNNDYPLEDLIIPYSGVDHIFSHMLTMYKTSVFVDDEWSVIQNLTFFYSEKIFTSNLEKYIPEVSIYPNPASTTIQFEMPNHFYPFHLEIYNLEGKLVKSEYIQNKTFVSVHSLSEGLFFYKLKTDKIQYSGKISIIR